jgi:hypothetical protein
VLPTDSTAQTQQPGEPQSYRGTVSSPDTTDMEAVSPRTTVHLILGRLQGLSASPVTSTSSVVCVKDGRSMK